MTDNVVEVKQLLKLIDNKPILNIRELALEAGQVHCLVGENGAGKSTLLHVLLGLESFDKGKVSILGHSAFDGSEAIRAKIGYMSSEFELPEDAKIKQILALQQTSFSDWNYDAFHQIIDRLQLDFNDKVSNLSLGQRRLLQLALVIAQQPALLILDEPSNGLDIQTQNQLFETLLNFDVFEQSSVIFTSHNPDEIERLSDNIVVINQGELMGQGSSSQISQLVHHWSFKTNNREEIANRFFDIGTITEVGETIFASVLSSANISEQELQELGATQIQSVKGSLSKAIATLTQLKRRPLNGYSGS